MSRRWEMCISLIKSGCALLGMLTLVLVPINIAGQELVTSRTDGHTPSALTAGSPVGSYPLSGFESVNPYNGALNFQFPLLSIGGRGSAAYTMMLPIETKWNVERHVWPPPNPTCSTGLCPWQNEQTNPVDFHMPVLIASAERYKPGKLETRNSGEGYTDCSPNDTTVYYVTTLTRFTFTAADGTQIEFRDAATGGQPRPNPMGSQCQSGMGFNRGKVFFAGDGSAATFISDTDVQDFTRAEDGPGSPTGHVRFADGTTYRVEDGQIVWIRDRNGNKVTATTDSLGRQVTVTLTDYQTTLFDQISYKGFGGAQRNIKVWYGPLSEILRVTQPADSATIKTYYQLFPGLNIPGLSNPDFNPFLVRRLELPDGRNYRFFYNVYAELTRIELPTGGAIEYDYDGGLTAGTSGLLNPSNPGIYRRVIERRVYNDATTLNSLEGKTTFSRPATDVDFVDVSELSATGVLLSRVRHFYHSHAANSFFVAHFPNEYTDWREGKEYKTEFYDANNSLLKRVEHLWEQTPATGAANNPHITRTTTTLMDITPNLVTKQEFTYDQYNNPIDQYEYDFGSGGPGPLKRRTHIDYVTDSAYTDAVAGAHLRRLRAQVSVFDVNNIERSRSSFEYDNYTAAPPNHASLIFRGNISGFDGTFSTGYSSRGNVTAITSHLLTNGSVTGSITAYSQYDIAGNVVKSLDPRAFVTDFEFFDRFGAPDGEARGHTQPAELGATSTFAFVTRVTNALAHQSYTQFDYYLGQPVDAEDANGMIVSAYFNDVLDRPTKVRRGVGTGLLNETTFAYDDGAARTITTTSDLDADRDLVSKTLYDGLGRTIETRTYEGGDNFIAVKQIPFTLQQDPDSGAWLRSTQSSNPYRLYLNEQPVWTTTFFDALGRVVKVRTPDNAIVRTSYSANTVTVKDQAGKTRKSVTDALGRLIEIYEDPEVPGGPPELDHQTTYTYDILDNLVKVTQGSQQRFFMYDSLKRLIRARNPEQGTLAGLNLLDSLTGNSAWSTAYQYDANSNLIQKTDARGVVSTYAYDALNRSTTIDYSDTVSINPDVSRLYDGATKGKGRLWSSEAGGTEKTVLTSYDELGRPLILQQSFKLPNNNWKLYETSRAYNLAGGVTSQYYPSNHSVTYNYDAAGRLGDKNELNPAFRGNLGDGVTRTYASGNAYTSWGSLFMEKFGTQTSLYHKLQYNIRGQLWDVRVSTGSDVNGSWNRGALQFFYESTLTHGASGPDNNGNVLKSSHYVPDDQGNALAIPHQLYTYDSLNRLTSVAEYFISDFQPLTQTSLQTNGYDRWGNRTISAAQTWGTGINNKQFTVDPNTNRLGVPSGQSGVMSYDSAGNLITDTYTGAGARNYDAENRMTQAWGGNNQWQYYTYNADGQRTRRKINGQETWLIYGFDGELLAEYSADGAVANPQKEYGYRNGQLLITAEPPRTNVALAANGATASASSQYSANYPAFSTINGDRRGLNWNNGGGWNDATVNTHPDWLQIDFNGSKTIDEINVITLQDNPATPAEPTESMTFTLYGLTGYSVQYWNGSAWTTVSGGTVSGNNKVWKKFTFPAVTTTKIRVLTSSSPDAYSRITEVEAWGNEAAPARTNFALGGLTSASSQYSANYPTFSTINGDRRGLNWNFGGGWNDATVNTHPDWLQIDFNGSKTIDEIDVFTLQDTPASPAEPTESMTFTLYGLTGYSVQYWNGSAWATVPGGTVSGNNKVWRKFTFAAITTTKIRVLTSSSPDAYSRLTEVEAWGPTEATASANVKWLVPDHLGTPRIIVDQTGNLANVRRHDYLPFGEELFAGTGGRTAAMGYAADGVRQQFTSKERDVETGLDYFLARYYSSQAGRFISPDEFTGGPQDGRVLGSGHAERQALVYADTANPQSLNKYQYTFNNPLRYVDPDGRAPQERLEMQIRRNEKDFAEGKITREEFLYRCRGLGLGVTGAVAIGLVLAGRQAVIPVLIWSARNPDKVEAAAYALQELMGGPPGVVTGITRMSKAELSMAEYLASRGHAVEKLAEVAQAGVKNPDFLVNGVKVELKTLGADALGSTLKNSISRAVGQGGGNVLIDARAATSITRAEAESAAARVFGADSRLNVVRIVGQNFDITIARQAQ